MKKQTIACRAASLLLIVCALCSIGSGALAAQIYPPQVDAARHPALSVEVNVVRDGRGKKTGFVELGLVAQTRELERFTYLSTSLQYNSDVLRPVSWTLTPDETGKLTSEQLAADAAALGLSGDRDYCGDLPVKADDRTDRGTAQGGGPSYMEPMGTGAEDAAFNALYFSVESRNLTGVALPDMTTLAVIRFYDLSGKFDTTGPSDAPVVTYDGATVTPESVTDLVRFTVDARAKASPAGQSVWYASTDSSFYYVASYDGTPVDVPFNGTALKAPDTTGRKVLAVDETKTPTDEGYYSYMTNLLEAVPFTVTSKLSYNIGGGTNVDDLATILFYDWDNTLLGVLSVEKGDARAEVNDYVEKNFIYPSLWASDHTGADYTDSTARLYTYRDETYPAEGPSGSTLAADGDDYALTNKLDYAFYKKVTTKAVDDAYPDPDDPAGTPITATVWTTHDVSTADPTTDPAIPENAEQYPYVNGWARVSDIKQIEGVWTTFGTLGELENCDPATGEYVTYDDSAYFDLVDFSDLDAGVYYVKACYEEGISLVPGDYYTVTKSPQYVRYSSFASADDGSAYSIQYQYGRMNLSQYGVRRARLPSLRVSYFPDLSGEEGKFFYQNTPVDNVDVLSIELTPSALVSKVEYVLVDGYGNTFVTGEFNSSFGNEAKILNNFTYSLEHPYNDHKGTDGFVYRATLQQVMEYGTKAAKSNINEDLLTFNGILTVNTLKDLNLRPSEGAEFDLDSINRGQILIFDAIQKAYETSTPAEGEFMDLDWHQLQYHIINADTTGYGTPTGITGGILSGGKILTPEECGGFNWCKLDNCKSKTVINISDLATMMDAAYKAIDGTDADTQAAAEEALGKLQGSFVSGTLRLYKDFEETDVKLSDLTPFTDGDPILVGRLKGLAVKAKAEGVLSGDLSWYQVQHYLKTETFDTTDPITHPYWWETLNEKPTAVEITNLASLVKAAHQSAIDGNTAAWDSLDLAVVSDMLHLFQTGVGDQISEFTKFTDEAVFKNTMEELIRQAHADGVNDTTLTWYQVQYYLIHATLKADGNVLRYVYWWETDTTRPTGDLESLLRAIIDVKVRKTISTEEFNQWFTLRIIDSDLIFRSNKDGNHYAEGDMADVETKLLALYGKISRNPNYYDSTTKTITLSWDQVQYYLINGSVVSDSVAKAERYEWRPGGTEDLPVTVTDLASLLLAAKQSIDDPGSTSLDSFSAETAAKLGFAMDNGTAIKEAQMTNIRLAVRFAVQAVIDVGMDFSSTSWDQIQYAILNKMAASDAVAAESTSNQLYWWKDDGEKATDLPTLLKAAKLAIDGRVANLNTFVFTDGEADVFYLRPSANGLFTQSEFLTAVQNAVRDAGDGYASLSWDQLQYYFLNGSHAATSGQAKEESNISYWWKDGGEPVSSDGSDLDYAVKTLLRAVQASLDGREAQLNTLTKDMVDGEPFWFRRNVSAESLDSMTTFISRVKAAVEAADDDYLNLDWNQLQYYLINLTLTTKEAAAQESADKYWWKAGQSKPETSITYDELLTAIIDVKVRKTMDTNDFTALLSVNGIKDTLLFHMDNTGTEYLESDLLALSNRMLGVYAKISRNKNYYDSTNKVILLSWAQFQYYLINGDIVSNDVALAESYPWAPASASIDLMEEELTEIIEKLPPVEEEVPVETDSLEEPPLVDSREASLPQDSTVPKEPDLPPEETQPEELLSEPETPATEESGEKGGQERPPSQTPDETKLEAPWDEVKSGGKAQQPNMPPEDPAPRESTEKGDDSQPALPTAPIEKEVSLNEDKVNVSLLSPERSNLSVEDHMYSGEATSTYRLLSVGQTGDSIVRKLIGNRGDPQLTFSPATLKKETTLDWCGECAA